MGQRLLEQRSSLDLDGPPNIAASNREDIERDKRRRRRLGEHRLNRWLNGKCHKSMLKLFARLYARARLRSAGARMGVGCFFDALMVSRLFRSASIRFTTLGGASISWATISRPSILASII